MLAIAHCRADADYYVGGHCTSAAKYADLVLIEDGYRNVTPQGHDCTWAFTGAVRGDVLDGGAGYRAVVCCVPPVP